MKPKILVLDIETSPIESWTWGIWDQNVGLEQIKTEWTILSFSAKWIGQSKTIFRHTGGRGAENVRDDKELCGQLWKLLNEADIIVGQNARKFDIRKINARLAVHGYGPYSPVRVVDTMVVAKRVFGFTSHKLAWMSQYMTDTPKSKHKKFPGFELWVECLKDNPKAWEEMRKYNVIDVIATEKLYKRLVPWMHNHPNMSAYSGGEALACSHCGSEKVVKEGFHYTDAGKYQQYSCKSCGGWGHGKTNLLGIEKRRSLLRGK